MIYGYHFSNYLVAPWGFLPWVLGGAVIFLLAVWSLAWKGIALWRAARLEQKWWFIAILVINTAGILEILYIYFFSEKAKRAE